MSESATGPRVWGLRFFATVIVPTTVLLVASLLGLRALLNDFGEAQPSRVEIINEFDFDLIRLSTGTGESLDEAFNRQDNIFVVLEPGQNTYGGSTMRGPNNCVSANTAIFFLRPNDDLGLEDREPPLVPVTLDDFELVSTLGPGFCFETRRDSSWIVGEPFLTREDFDE